MIVIQTLYGMEENISIATSLQSKLEDTLLQSLAQLGKELTPAKLKNELKKASAPAKFSFYEKFIAARLAKIAHMACEHPKKFTVLSLVLRELLQTPLENKKSIKLEQTPNKSSPHYPSDFVQQLTCVKKTALNTVVDKITCVVCSSDNKTVFIGDDNGTIRIWNISDFLNPFLIQTFFNETLSPSSCIYSLILTTNNNTLFSLSSINIKIRDVSNPNDPTLIAIFDQSENGQHSSLAMAMSSDDKILFSGSSNSTIKIWEISDLEKPKLIRTINESNNNRRESLLRLNLSADDKTLFSVSKFNSSINIWNIADLKNPKLLKTLNLHSNKPLYAFAISTDAKTLFHTYQDGFKIIDISNPTKPKNIQSKIKNNIEINYLELSTDNKTLFIGSRFSAIQMWNVSNAKKPKLLDTKDTLSNAISMIKFSPNNRLLFYKGENKNLTIAHYPDLFVPTLADYLTQLPSSSLGILQYFFIKEIINHKKQQIQKGSQHTNPLAITHPFLKELFKQFPRELRAQMGHKKYVTFTTPLYNIQARR